VQIKKYLGTRAGHLSCLGLVLSQSCIVSALAVGEAAPVEEAAPAGALEEIIVTAEHKSARLQDTPIVITAITGDTLQQQHITTFETLATMNPDVQFSTAVTDARIFIRGVGLDSLSPGSDPRVAIYTDQVYNARPQTGLSSFFDVDRIEILEGPQGTLYGRNATAGAINIISRDPGDKFNGYGTVTFGNYGLVQTEGAVGGPLNDTFAGRIAFTTQDHSGYGRNISTGEPVDDAHRGAVRAKLQIKPTDYATIMLQADYADEVDHSGGLHFLGNSPGNEDFGQEQGYAVASNIRDYAGQGPDDAIRSSGASALATIDLGKITLTSISGYRHLDSGQETTADQSTGDFLPVNYFERSSEFTQELRFAGTFGPVDALLGGYYFHENNSALVHTVFISSAYFPAFAEPENCCIGIPQQQGPFAQLEGEYAGGTQSTNAYAVFSQETIHFTDSFGLDVGGRYSYEKRNMDQFFQFDLGRPANSIPILDPAAVTYANQEKSWSAFDPKATLHYKITNDILAYATYTKGFKSGGFNFSVIQPAFNPENLTDYEAGIKADLFDRRLRLNVGAFHYKYSNLQVNVTYQTALLTTNAAGANLSGVEAQIEATPIDNLHAALNMAWLNSRYTSYNAVDPGSPARGTLDLSGNRLQYAPRWKINGLLSYKIETPWGDFTPRADVTFTDQFYFSQFNLPYNSQSSYAIGDAYLDYDMKNGWTATAFAQNVTDKLYVIASTQSSLFLGDQLAGEIGAPRTFGVSITKRF
jgi:iron complex outermembrane receptor protein